MGYNIKPNLKLPTNRFQAVKLAGYLAMEIENAETREEVLNTVGETFIEIGKLSWARYFLLKAWNINILSSQMHKCFLISSLVEVGVTPKEFNSSLLANSNHWERKRLATDFLTELERIMRGEKVESTTKEHCKAMKEAQEKLQQKNTPSGPAGQKPPTKITHDSLFSLSKSASSKEFFGLADFYRKNELKLAHELSEKIAVSFKENLLNERLEEEFKKTSSYRSPYLNNTGDALKVLILSGNVNTASAGLQYCIEYYWNVLKEKRKVEPFYCYDICYEFDLVELASVAIMLDRWDHLQTIREIGLCSNLEVDLSSSINSPVENEASYNTVEKIIHSSLSQMEHSYLVDEMVTFCVLKGLWKKGLDWAKEFEETDNALWSVCCNLLLSELDFTKTTECSVEDFMSLSSYSRKSTSLAARVRKVITQQPYTVSPYTYKVEIISRAHMFEGAKAFIKECYFSSVESVFGFLRLMINDLDFQDKSERMLTCFRLVQIPLDIVSEWVLFLQESYYEAIVVDYRGQVVGRDPGIMDLRMHGNLNLMLSTHKKEQKEAVVHIHDGRINKSKLLMSPREQDAQDILECHDGVYNDDSGCDIIDNYLWHIATDPEICGLDDYFQLNSYSVLPFKVRWPKHRKRQFRRLNRHLDSLAEG